MAKREYGVVVWLCGRSKYVGQLNKCPLPHDGLYISSQIGKRSTLSCLLNDVLGDYVVLSPLRMHTCMPVYM